MLFQYISIIKIYNFIGFMYIISRLFCKSGNSNKSKNASVRLLFFSSDNIFFILSSVNPKQDAKRLNALRLSVGISEYMLFIGVSLFIAFSICFFLIIISLPFVYSNHTHTATDEHTPTSFPLYHPQYTGFPLHTELY